MNYCPNCGTELEANWRKCPSCGFNIEAEETIPPLNAPTPRITQQPQIQLQYQYKQKRSESNTNGIVALICGILGIIAVPLVCSIIAIYFGRIGLKKDDNTSLANAGYILGIIGLCWFVIILIIIFSLISFMWTHYP